MTIKLKRLKRKHVKTKDNGKKQDVTNLFTEFLREDKDF